jgi:subtilisin family serine protease
MCASSVYVGVIDEGVMISHPDLAANIGTNPGEIAGDGIDNDGNGYVDDVNGWDFAGNDNTVYDGKQDDHGTHVSGTIGAVGGNGAGVAGVCWNVKILNAKFLGRNGGTTANAIKAIDYLTDLKTRHGLNLVATNNSWGGGGYSKALQDAIERANQMNILFIAAAGNSSVNNDTSPHYPSSYTNVNVIAVASITSTGALSSFSNYGATSVDLAAPGSGIWSTVPGRKSPSYASYSGTSMATPHVTGAAAMYASAHPGATAGQIKAAILGSVVPTPSLSGKTVTGGRLNVSGF